MERPVRGDVVVVPFPFSDLSQSKRRPALVVAGPRGDDLILCQITSQSVRDGYAIPLTSRDFVEGGLHKDSNVRPNRIFTADFRIVLHSAGRLASSSMQAVTDAIVDILRR